MATAPTIDDTAAMIFADAAEWERWLEAEHARSAGAWIMIAKASTRGSTVTITEALDIALCFGWIDSHRKGLDGDHYLQRYTPRRPKGSWSQVNVAKVEALMTADRMRPSGLAAVRAAQADGRWAAAYPSQRDAGIPPDLAAALALDDAASEAFDRLDRTHRYALFLQLAKSSAANRGRRLARIVEDLSRSGG